MPQPPQDGDTLFEDWWHDLPLETVPMAHECKAFTRARQVKTPKPLLRLVLLSCGLDHSLREVAGHFTRLVERMTERAGAERCCPACWDSPRWTRGPLRGACWSSMAVACKRREPAGRSIGCPGVWTW